MAYTEILLDAEFAATAISVATEQVTVIKCLRRPDCARTINDSARLERGSGRSYDADAVGLSGRDCRGKAESRSARYNRHGVAQVVLQHQAGPGHAANGAAKRNAGDIPLH